MRARANDSAALSRVKCVSARREKLRGESQSSRRDVVVAYEASAFCFTTFEYHYVRLSRSRLPRSDHQDGNCIEGQFRLSRPTRFLEERVRDKHLCTIVNGLPGMSYRFITEQLRFCRYALYRKGMCKGDPFFNYSGTLVDV